MGYKHDYILFTDASQRNLMTVERNYTAFGWSLLNVNECTYVYHGDRCTMFCSSAARAEIYAIYQGMKAALKLTSWCDEPIRITVISDNKNAVEALSKLIKFVWNRSGPVWRRRSGDPVQNQDIYERIVELWDNNPNVRFTYLHINSHKNVYQDWYYIRGKMRAQGVMLSEDAAKLFIRMNHLVDKIASDQTAKDKKEDDNGVGFFLLRTKGEWIPE